MIISQRETCFALELKIDSLRKTLANPWFVKRYDESFPSPVVYQYACQGGNRR